MKEQLRILPTSGFDYVVKGNPTVDVNPKRVPVTWLNIVTGELFVCRDNTPGSNIWQGQRGTLVSLWTAADPYFEKVSLLLPMFGDNNSTVFKDYSYQNNSIVVTNTPKISTNVFKFYGSSGFFTGTGELTVFNPLNQALSVADFTVELYFYLNAVVDSEYHNFFRMNYGSLGMVLRFGNSGFGNRLQASLDQEVLGSVWSTPKTKAQCLNLWTHVAFTRQSGVCKLFIDGTQQSLASGTGSTYSNTSFPATQNITGVTSLRLGAGHRGYIQDLRITREVARYTANFTPPTRMIP